MHCLDPDAIILTSQINFSIYVSLHVYNIYSFLAPVNYSSKVGSAVACLENIIIIIKVKDHYKRLKTV